METPFFNNILNPSIGHQNNSTIPDAFLEEKGAQFVFESLKPEETSTEPGPIPKVLLTTNEVTNSLNKRVYFEHFDQIALMKILSHPAVQNHSDNALIPTLTNYLRSSKNGIKKVSYKRTDHKLGRLYGSCSMQGFPRPIRHTIAGALYWDIDICNCHPQLLSQMCKKYGF